MDVPRLLGILSRKHGSQDALAENLGVHPTYLGMVMKRKVEPGPKILEPLGLERVVSYRRKRTAETQ